MRPAAVPAAIGLALLLAGCPGGPPAVGGLPPADPAVLAQIARRPDLAKSRVFLLGLDGCDPRIVKDLVEKGGLPNFRRLMDEGAFGPLRSQQPMLSPLLWTTVATGKWPTEHGVLDFMVRSRSDPKQRETVTSRHRQVESIWDIAGRHGKSVGVVGWLASHPAERVNGVAVSERTELLAYLFHQQVEPSDEGKTWPPGLLAEVAPLRRRPADVPFSELAPFLHVSAEEYRAACAKDEFTSGNRTNNLRLVYTGADNFRRVGGHLWRERRPSLLCAYFEMLDAISHNFMAYREPVTWKPRGLREIREFLRDADPAFVEKVYDADRRGKPVVLEKGEDPRIAATILELARGADLEKVARWKDAVDGAYAWTDRLLGEVMGMIDADTTLLVVSDHGFASDGNKPPFDSSFQSRLGGASFHLPEGVFGAWGNGVRKGLGIPYYDRFQAGTGARSLDHYL